MKVLNLYAGIGGNRKLWNDVEVTAVELDPAIAKIYQDYFPDDTVIVADAHQYLLDHFDNFDFIWSSPPCPSHSRMMKATRHNVVKYPDMRLYQEIILLNNFFKGLWAVENVKPYYEPLIAPTAKYARHYFWGNINLGLFEPPNQPKGFIISDSPKAIQEMKDWLDIHYDGNVYIDGNHSPGQVLRNCVHPETGLYILNCARNIITKQNEKQIDIFE